MSVCVNSRCAALGVCNCGAPRACDNCRYWSEMVARSEGGSIQALCLNPSGPKRHRFTAGASACPAWASAHLGVIDAPGQDPNAYSAEQAEESAA